MERITSSVYKRICKKEKRRLHTITKEFISVRTGRIRFLRDERFDSCGRTRDQSNNLLRPPSTVDCERSSAWLARIERGRAAARAAERGRAARLDGASRALPGGRTARSFREHEFAAASRGVLFVAPGRRRAPCAVYCSRGAFSARAIVDQ